MDNYIKMLIVSAVYLVLDFIWIFLNIREQNENIIRIQGKQTKLTYKRIAYIIICYALILLSILHIAIPLTLNNIRGEDDLQAKAYKSIIYGGSVGFCIYGIYNLISLILYEKYEITLALIDTAWGWFIYSLITFLYLLLK
jgi:uncharacterized membrane protein